MQASLPVFGDPKHIGAQRGIGEIRAGRPVRMRASDGDIVTAPVDGLDDHRLAAFRTLCGTQATRLALTAVRARHLGIATDAPVLLTLAQDVTAAEILAFAGAEMVRCEPAWTPASAAAGAALELAKLAHRMPAMLMAPAQDFSLGGDVLPITIEAAAVIEFQSALAQSLVIAGEANIPLQNGVATRFVVFSDAGGNEAVAIIVKDIDQTRPVPVRLHSACLTGDVFGSRRCDCGDQLRLALDQIAQLGGGIILYLDQEGRGLGLTNKLHTYRLQDAGLDTVDANTTLGFDDDERDYRIAAGMLRLLGCPRIELLTNNPAKIGGLAEAGIDIVRRLPLVAPVRRENRRYLTAKAARAGHRIDGLAEMLNAKE